MGISVGFDVGVTVRVSLTAADLLSGGSVLEGRLMLGEEPRSTRVIAALSFCEVGRSRTVAVAAVFVVLLTLSGVVFDPPPHAVRINVRARRAG